VAREPRAVGGPEKRRLPIDYLLHSIALVERAGYGGREAPESNSKILRFAKTVGEGYFAVRRPSSSPARIRVGKECGLTFVPRRDPYFICSTRV
jgi:hypothetical protein